MEAEGQGDMDRQVIETELEINKSTGMQTDRQVNRKMDRYKYKQIDKEKEKVWQIKTCE